METILTYSTYLSNRRNKESVYIFDILINQILFSFIWFSNFSNDFIKTFCDKSQILWMTKSDKAKLFLHDGKKIHRLK